MSHDHTLFNVGVLASAIVWLSASAGAAFGHEHPAGPLNRFPHDHHDGPVPQERGQDERPPAAGGQHPGLTTPQGPAPIGAASTLVLYDDTGPYGWLGELYAMAAGNLVSRFGAWSAKPVMGYEPGDLLDHDATIYIGSTYDPPLPVAFLDDVLTGTRPVVWMYDNIWQLANRAPNFVGTHGYNPWIFDTSPISKVHYKGVPLDRYAANGAGIMTHSVVDPAVATVLATAERADGSSIPWALRSGNLTYIGEIPFAYITEGDRYIAFCDLLFDALAPATPEQHRALVRLEDVGAKSDPEQLEAIADYLYSEGVPFSIALIPRHVDPNGAYNEGAPGTPEEIRLKHAPEVVAALQYMIDRGGTLIQHGFTHQYESALNPYTGASGDDFEFYMAHVNAEDRVIYDGPTPGDSMGWARKRVQDGRKEIAQAHLPEPLIFEYPHYAGSAVDSRALSALFDTAYHRGLYFGGGLTGLGDDHARMIGQFFPYVVWDIYGWKVLPENLGNYEPEPYNTHPARLPAEIVATAHKNLVIRDGFASFFFHPYLELAALQEIVQGIKAAGYTFVSPAAL